MALTDRDRAILDLERGWWQDGRPKKWMIRDCLGLSSTRYYQLLGALVDTPDALAHDQLLVRRLRRQREERRRARFEPPPALAPRGR